LPGGGMGNKGGDALYTPILPPDEGPEMAERRLGRQEEVRGLSSNGKKENQKGKVAPDKMRRGN